MDNYVGQLPVSWALEPVRPLVGPGYTHIRICWLCCITCHTYVKYCWLGSALPLRT